MPYGVYKARNHMTPSLKAPLRPAMFYATDPEDPVRNRYYKVDDFAGGDAWIALYFW
jgi:hypothetical protein